MSKLTAIATLIVFGPLAFYATYTLVRDTVAMIKAPKGQKIEAYYTSVLGYNPFTGKKGRKL